MSVRIIVGDCLDQMREMPADSVHCGVSSPPYWGLRDYGIQPSIWGGDQACEHVFVDETIERQIRKGLGLEALGERYRGGGKKHGKIATVFEFKRGFCIHCNAWRGCFGLEPTPDLFIDHLVMIFEEVRRVLRPDGVLWLNLGDSYASATEKGNSGDGTSTLNGSGQAYQDDAPRPRGRPAPGSTSVAGYRGARPAQGKHEYAGASVTIGPDTQPNRMPIAGLKPKDMVGIPWMAAFALRRAGWWLRQDIIWHKPNPMPESTYDRCTKSHEYIFLLSKSERYFYDAEAIKEPASDNTHPRGRGIGKKNAGITRESGVSNCSEHSSSKMSMVATRNKRSVWTVATQPFAEAHFATFPPALIEPCIQAGTSERGCCVQCATPWRRMVSKSRENASNAALAGNLRPKGKGTAYNDQHVGTDDDIRNGPVLTTVTLGWWPDCRCEGLPAMPLYPKRPDSADKRALKIWGQACVVVDASRKRMCDGESNRKTVRAVVLDPFGGAGTTGLVADRLQRDAVLIEKNPEYAEMARRRIYDDAPLLAAE